MGGGGGCAHATHTGRGGFIHLRPISGGSVDYVCFDQRERLFKVNTIILKVLFKFVPSLFCCDSFCDVLLFHFLIRQRK